MHGRIQAAYGRMQPVYDIMQPTYDDKMQAACIPSGFGRYAPVALHKRSESVQQKSKNFYCLCRSVGPHNVRPTPDKYNDCNVKNTIDIE